MCSGPDEQCQSDAGWAARGPVFSSGGGRGVGRGQSHMAPGLLQGVWTSCRAAPCQDLSGDWWKKGREGRGVTQTSEREVVCSGARGRGRDDASSRPL